MTLEEAKIFQHRLDESGLFISEEYYDHGYGYVLRGTRYAIVWNGSYQFRFEDTCTLRFVSAEEVLDKVFEIMPEDFCIKILFNLDLFVQVL